MDTVIDPFVVGRDKQTSQVLTAFLRREARLEAIQAYAQLRLAGYALEVNFDSITLITCDVFKAAIGGLPRSAFLIMTQPLEEIQDNPYFIVLRVLETAPTPLARETQQAFFELHKRAMPALDMFTQAELQWSALKASVLGTFYTHPEQPERLEFAGDLRGLLSAHRYRIYAPDERLSGVISNALVPIANRFEIGVLRPTECRWSNTSQTRSAVTVHVSLQDLLGRRTALFGKTRLGKSNTVKRIVQNILETTTLSQHVGQLIFDVNGEYANDNPQDGAVSLRSAFPDRCTVYALSPKPATPSRPLKLDFYEHPDRSHRVLVNMLSEDNRTAMYVTAFRSVGLPAIHDLPDLPPETRTRARRKLLIYWAVLYKAGFIPNEVKLHRLMSFDPGYNQHVRTLMYPDGMLPAIHTLADLLNEIEHLAEAAREHDLRSSSGRPLLDADEEALLGFLKPKNGSGPLMIQNARRYHDPKASNCVQEIVDLLAQGRTVIVDLGNADEEVMRYFCEEITRAVFARQVDKFASNNLGELFIQIYYEEAHDLFPAHEEATVSIYRRVGKEGAKYQIGMVYSTQSVTTINHDLLAQTENFFVAHLSSRGEVEALAQVNTAFESVKEEILGTRTPGYVQMLTQSQRFVVPVQIHRFAPERERQLRLAVEW